MLIRLYSYVCFKVIYNKTYIVSQSFIHSFTTTYLFTNKQKMSSFVSENTISAFSWEMFHYYSWWLDTVIYTLTDKWLMEFIRLDNRYVSCCAFTWAIIENSSFLFAHFLNVKNIRGWTVWAFIINLREKWYHIWQLRNIIEVDITAST